MTFYLEKSLKQSIILNEIYDHVIELHFCSPSNCWNSFGPDSNLDWTNNEFEGFHHQWNTMDLVFVAIYRLVFHRHLG